MKKLLFAVCGLITLGMSGVANAGLATTGYVYVEPTYMRGTMNNRYNGIPNTYIGGYGYANSSVSFYGRDADNDFFSCYVPTTSALYSQAFDIKNNLKNGSYLLVYKSSTTSECTSIFLRNSSDIMD